MLCFGKINFLILKTGMSLSYSCFFSSIFNETQLKYFLFLTVFLLFIGCRSQKKWTSENYMSKGAPNMVQVNDSLFCDKTEIANIDWLFYEYCIRKDFGTFSSELLSVLPDTMLWNRFDQTEILQDQYYRYPGFRMYPVVGLSLSQARNYAEWRTDMVFSSMMSNIGRLPERNNNNRKSPKTTENEPYVTVKEYFESHPEDIGKISYFEYRIPTEKDWICILQNLEIAKLKEKRIKKRLCKEEEPLSISVISINDTTALSMNNHIHNGCPNALGIYNLNSNVAELINDDRYTMGSCWIDEKPMEAIRSKAVINHPNAYTGFRCVGYWKKWGE